MTADKFPSLTKKNIFFFNLFVKIYGLFQVLGGLGVHPWTVSLLADGEYVCSASLIHPKYLLASWDCGVSLLRR